MKERFQFNRLHILQRKENVGSLKHPLWNLLMLIRHFNFYLKVLKIFPFQKQKNFNYN